MKRIFLPALVLTALLATAATPSFGQSFGIELLNNVKPRSGGMAGASIARPQDVQSAINGNPASLTQYHGTQFAFGSAWIEPTYNLTVDAPGLPLLGISPFSNAKSDSQGIAAGNIGVTQDLNALGKPVTLGLGLFAGAGAGVDFRHIPESNGSNAMIVALDIVAGAGVKLTDDVSFGANLTVSNATLDGPFVGITGASADYGLRGGVGLNYDVNDDTAIGLYWKSKISYTFQNLIGLGGPPTIYQNVAVDRPEIVGLGIANSSLMDGRLLLAVDATFQSYTATDLFGAIFEDQWAVQVGAQYAANDRVILRTGYAWNENPMRANVGGQIGGIVPPQGAAHVQYIQAMFAAIPQHRVTAGVTVLDVLPGLDMDFYGGGAFESSETFGITTAKVQSYWVGTGFTWRFGRGSCEEGW